MTTRHRLLACCGVAAAIALAGSCTGSNNRPPRLEADCANFPVIRPGVPFDVDVPSHANVQCFAWQEFIALNWPARPGAAGEPDTSRTAATFGEPGDSAPAVWETYKEAHEVFLPDARPPSPWGRSGLRDSLPASFHMSAELADVDQADGMQVLRMTSKVSERAILSTLSERAALSPELEEIMQASGGWLTGQNRKLTYYGLHMNRVEFDYIVSNGFYDARRQRGRLINLPAGRTGRGDDPTPEEGAIEVKSAWLELTDPALFRRYRTARACIVEGGACRWATVGLVGLHIVHKTETFPQWTWATFEHVDNAPDRERVRQGSLRGRYNYFDPGCPAGRPECVPNQVPTGPDRTRPVQVVRETPFDAETRLLNDRVRRLIRSANRNSVFRFYRLVDVQWPEAGEPVNTVRNGPLPLGGPRPTSLANAVLETYVQHTPCLACHRHATVAGGAQTSDYSFFFSMAAESP